MTSFSDRLPRLQQGFHPTFWVANGMELFERLAYYGQQIVFMVYLRNRLGFTEADYDRPVEKLSGGYRMPVALAHLLLSNPDVLMLDEPTNHLDKPTQRWFEQFLIQSGMTLLIISHDTAFLDRVVTHIWELRHHKIEEYRGNYSLFTRLKEERRRTRRASGRAAGCWDRSA